ncbi:hypothetical protein CPB84DRAFT_1855200 [Gymnopilus junonius]|uniref:Uncharacterized protein n=1 Tax=Gymnopilus junonius TaxID=109634 RepID=A0A9P5TES3_GYMJU|nr:hypothetical protein CPB84DRAFT_1855200 [Gymnopilus junonius]
MYYYVSEDVGSNCGVRDPKGSASKASHHSYSDVVASQPGTSASQSVQVEDTPLAPSRIADKGARAESDNARIVDVQFRVNKDTIHASSLFGSDNEDDGQGPWTTVPRWHPSPPPALHKRAKRMDQKKPAMGAIPRTLDKELASVISEAEKSSTSSCEEGPSRPKGKGADFRNWKGLISDDEDLNLESQKAALKSINQGLRKDKPPHMSQPPSEMHPRASETCSKNMPPGKVRTSKPSRNMLPATVQAVS